MKKITKQEAQDNILKKYPHIKITKYNGIIGQSEFTDSEFGIFIGKYSGVLSGRTKHPRRMTTFYLMPFHEVKRRLEEKFTYLTLLEYTAAKKAAKFHDHEYGEFKAKFCYVFNESARHPERSAFIKDKARRDPKRVEKMLKTFEERFGGHPQAIKEIRDKGRKTCMEKYGVSNPFQSEICKNKAKVTNLKNYGCEHISQAESIKDKKQDTLMKNYGVRYPSQSSVIQDKIKKTFNLNYGQDHPMKNKVFLMKWQLAYYKKYNVSNPFQRQEIKDKIKKTINSKYGVSYVMQKQEFINKAIRTKMKNNTCYDVDGHSLKAFYENSNLKIAYSTLTKNYKIVGRTSLSNDYYNALVGKSKSANLWLSYIEDNLKYKLIREYHIPNTKYHADGYDPKTNTIYEFYGDYWHGYPFKNMGINAHSKISFNTLFYQTLDRENKLKEMGYKIISIWESEYHK